MLKQEQSAAAEARVTASELAGALASLESRKAASGGTLPLGEAIAELSLDATPEELLAEVEAQRAQIGEVTRRLSVGRQRSGLVASMAALLLLSGVMALGTVALTGSPSVPRVVESDTSFQGKILVRDQSDNGDPLVRTLAEVPAGRTVRASADAVYWSAVFRESHVGPGRPFSQTESSLTWPVVKLGGELYVRGWVRERLSNEAARLTTVAVYNTPDTPTLGPHPIPVTVRLTYDMFGDGPSHESRSGAERFFFAKLRPNKYAWAKW